MLRCDKGSGSALGLGMFLGLALLGAIAITATELVIQQNRLQVIADTLAIAASDTLIGLVAGEPCESAVALAKESLVELNRCSIVSESVQISVVQKTLGIVLSAEAIAEPMR